MTLHQALQLAKKDKTQGYISDYYVDGLSLFYVSDQGEYKVFPMPECGDPADWL